MDLIYYYFIQLIEENKFLIFLFDRALNVDLPDSIVRVSEHIPEIIQFI